MSAQQFYNACLEGKLSVKYINVNTKGRAQQKLAVLPYLSELLYGKCMVGDFINSGYGKFNMTESIITEDKYPVSVLDFEKEWKVSI